MYSYVILFNNYYNKIKIFHNNMKYFNDDIIIHLTKYINIPEYKNMVLTCKYFRDTIKKCEKVVLLNIINNEGYDISVFENYQRIKLTKKNNTYCCTVPRNISIKTLFKDFFEKYG